MSGFRPEPGPGLGELIGTVATDIQELVRGEVRLARAELDQKIDKLIAGGVSVLGGALVAFAGLVVLLEGAGAALALVLPAWAALLIVGAVIIAVGALVARSGLSALSLKSITPDRTAASLQKDARVVKENIR